MSYSRISDHVSMVFDEIRNTAYSKALAEAITPDSVVLDLGAGLGILGLLAARLGARKVYLAEQESLVNFAREVAAANGLENRIEILQGKIEELILPEPVDIIVSVFTGNLLYSEDLLPALFHARDHFLKPGGKLVPDLAQLWLAPVSCPTLHDRHVGIWSRRACDLDFADCRRAAANEIIWLKQDEIECSPLAAGKLASEIDLMQSTSADCESETRFSISGNGECHGMLGWLKIRLGQYWLSTGTEQPALHWSNGLLPVDPPLQLAKGENLALKLQKQAFGDWHWQLAAGDSRRAHSTFLSRANGTAYFEKHLPDYCNTLSCKGQAILLTLSMIRDGKTNSMVIAALQEQFPGQFPDLRAASRFVHGVVQEFTT